MDTTSLAARPPPDLSTCDTEPIHLPGRVQPHGVLLVLGEPAFLIEQASRSALEHFGFRAEELIGRGVESALGVNVRLAIAGALASEEYGTANPLTVTIAVAGRPRLFDAVAHRHEGRLVVEFENGREVGEEPPLETDRLVRFTLSRLQGEWRVREFCQATAKEVRAFTGFDRVMVYRFDPDWNGEVFAEEKSESLEPFLGLHYPASDIPAQARRLYALSLVRHIPDVAYDASPLVPEADPRTGRHLDLTHAALRSVSPIHVEYLRNMGVAASLSISIMKGGRLWGLVACHHYSPRYVAPRLRAACESLGVLVSLQLTSKLDSEELRCRVDAGVRQARLTNALTGSADLEAAVVGRWHDYLAFTGAQGGAVVQGGRITLVGHAPNEGQVRLLIEWLKGSFVDGVYSTHAASADFPPAGDFGDVASGVLAVCLSADREDYLLWFRPEVVESVRWGGDPQSKRVVAGPNGPRLSPRGSFALWRAEQRGRSRFWSSCEREAALSLRDAALVALVRRSSELVAEGRRKDEFLAVLAHELRNPLAPIRNALEVLRMCPGDPARVEWAREVGERQTRHLGRMIDDLMDVSRVGQGKLRLDVIRLDLASVVHQAAEDHRPALAAKGIGMEILLPERPVPVQGDPTRLTQAVGNFLTNAGKFTDSGGRVSVCVSQDGVTGRARVSVSDTGVGMEGSALARAFDPFEQAERSLSRSRDGLGIGLALVRGIVALHGGEAWARSEGVGRGSEFGFWLPSADGIVEPGAVSGFEAGIRSGGLRVLVIDDNRDGADSLTLLLEIEGHAARSAYTGEEGVGLAREFRPDVVFCDIRLPDLSGYEVARTLKRDPATAGCRVIAITGLGPDESAEECLAAGIQRRLTKPVRMAELREVLAGVGSERR